VSTSLYIYGLIVVLWCIWQFANCNICATLCGRFRDYVPNRHCYGDFSSMPDSLWSIYPYAPTRAVCSSTSKLLQVPRTNLRFGSHSVCVSAPTLWNSLPRSIHFCESL